MVNEGRVGQREQEEDMMVEERREGGLEGVEERGGEREGV